MQLPFAGTPPSPSGAAAVDDDDDGWLQPSGGEVERDPAFIPLAALRGAASPAVRVRGCGSDAYDAFVSYHINTQPAAANKPLMVVLFVLMWDMLVNGALQYAAGPHAAVRAGDDPYRRGVVPNRLGIMATLAVWFLPGAPGVGKTCAVRCAPRRVAALLASDAHAAGRC